jgi:hypothetical protein
MFGDWEVNIIEQWSKNTNKVYLYKYEADGVSVLGKDGVLHLVKEGVRDGDDHFFAEMTNRQLQAFANSLAERGIKTTNDSKNEGQLIATKAHLEDMRSLVFKSAKPKHDTLQITNKEM